MSLSPLLAAPPAIQIHFLAAIAALLSGAAVVFLRKGTPRHRLLGRIAAAGMATAAITSYWIRPASGGFSWIHLLSILTLVSLTIGLIARRRGDIRTHKRWMIGAYSGLVVAGLFTLLPGRIMHAVVFGP